MAQKQNAQNSYHEQMKYSVWKLKIQRQEYGLESVSWHKRSESDNAANSTG